MNKSLLSVACLGMLSCSVHAGAFVDYASVRAVEPQYDSVPVARNECAQQWINPVRPTLERDYGGAVVGGIAGALLGNQVGRGHGREAATAVGAVVGAMAGDNMIGRDRLDDYPRAPRPVTTCHAVQELQPRLTGYRVQYEYRGQMYSTFLRDAPGTTLRVRVSVDPV